MRCENCGKSLPEDSAFCAECGARTRPRSAGEMADFTHTAGLVRSREAGVVPEPADPAEAVDSVPPIPDVPALPDEVRTAAGYSGFAPQETVPEEFIAAARLREEKRRAAQTLMEAAQLELPEESERLPEPDTMIWEQEAAEEGGHVGMGAPPPPPPPPSDDERIWAETRERAERYGVSVPLEIPRDSLGRQGRRLLEASREPGEESRGQNCCAYGCLALMVVMFLSFLIGAIINIGQ